MILPAVRERLEAHLRHPAMEGVVGELRNLLKPCDSSHRSFRVLLAESQCCLRSTVFLGIRKRLTPTFWNDAPLRSTAWRMERFPWCWHPRQRHCGATRILTSI